MDCSADATLKLHLSTCETATFSDIAETPAYYKYAFREGKIRCPTRVQLHTAGDAGSREVMLSGDKDTRPSSVAELYCSASAVLRVRKARGVSRLEWKDRFEVNILMAAGQPRRERTIVVAVKFNHSELTKWCTEGSKNIYVKL